MRPLVEAAAERCRKDPRDASALASLGMLYHGNEAPALAAAAYEGALRIRPDDARTSYFLGLIREEQGATAEALARFGRARDLEPRYAPARRHLGTALLEAGRAQEAAVELREAARLDPTDADARVALAQALRQAGALEDALAVAQDALRLVPEHPGAHQVAALVLMALGRSEEAGPHLAKGRVYHASVVRDPWFRDVQKLGATIAGALVQAELYLENGKAASAVRLLEPVARAHPERADVGQKLAQARAALRPGESR